MFVATEDLWRMRLEVGSTHHARFWGQTIQFLTLSRLLGQNKQITLETDRMTYNTGEQIKLFANVLTESFEPVELPDYTVILEQDGQIDSAVEINLSMIHMHISGGSRDNYCKETCVSLFYPTPTNKPG